LLDHLDKCDDVGTKFTISFGRNPVLGVNGATDGLNRKTTQVRCRNAEARNEAGPAGLNVPVPSNLSCIFAIRHRIKDGLI